jgi:peptidyl-prolyl cis-trans isomerase B (cyclophilin B)
VFGYVTGGMDAVAKLQTGDVIRSARVTSGADRLVLPAAGNGEQQVAAAPALSQQ